MRGILYRVSMSTSKQVVHIKNKFCVMRYLKNADNWSSYGWQWFKNLGPSPELFSKTKKLQESGEWGEDSFNQVYSPKYLKELQLAKSNEFSQYNVIKNLLLSGEDVAIMCGCADFDHCHTKLLTKSLIEDTGCSVNIM